MRELERGEGGERGKEGEGGVGWSAGVLVSLSPPNPAPPYKPAEIGQQSSVLLLKTQPGHWYPLSLNTSQVRTA